MARIGKIKSGYDSILLHHSPKPGQRRLLLFSVIVLSCYLVFFRSPTPEPTSALAQALECIEDKSYGEARRLLGLAHAEPNLQHWVNFYEAKLLQEVGNVDEAAARYRAMARLDNAASPDAGTALLELAARNAIDKLDTKSLRKEIEKLEVELVRRGRGDLFGKLSLIRAGIAAKNGETKLALEIYAKLRKKHLGSHLATEAKKAFYGIVGDRPQLFSSLPMGDRIAEIRLLLRESSHLEALQQLQALLKKQKQGSNAYYELLFLEERALRGLGKVSEANRVLALIAKGEDLTFGTKALEQMAMNHWNRDEDDMASLSLEELLLKSPKSPAAHRAKFIKARIESDKKRHHLALKLYSKLARETKDSRIEAKALRQSLLLNLAMGEYKKCIELSKKIVRLSTSFAKKQRGYRGRKWFDYRSEALYWWDYSLKKLGRIDENKDSPAAKKLFSLGPPNYYTTLLGGNRLAEFFADSPKAPPPLYSSLIPENLRNRLRLLSSVGLEELAMHELSWFFSGAGRRLKAQKSKSFLEKSLSKAELYANYAPPHLAVRKAELLFDEWSRFIKSEKGDFSMSPEGRKLLDLFYPLAYFELFKSAARKHSVPVSLALAIAHTESRFDPGAISPKGAMGMLQMLPKTAELEGLGRGESLMNPATAVELGVKHIARLLGEFKGNEIRAIAAYNAGAEATKKWIDRYSCEDERLWIEFVSYPETRNYIKKVVFAEEIYRAKLKSYNLPQKKPIPPEASGHPS